MVSEWQLLGTTDLLRRFRATMMIRPHAEFGRRSMPPVTHCEGGGMISFQTRSNTAQRKARLTSASLAILLATSWLTLPTIQARATLPTNKPYCNLTSVIRSGKAVNVWVVPKSGAACVLGDPNDPTNKNGVNPVNVTITQAGTVIYVAGKATWNDSQEAQTSDKEPRDYADAKVRCYDSLGTAVWAMGPETNVWKGSGDISQYPRGVFASPSVGTYTCDLEVSNTLIDSNKTAQDYN